MTVVAVCGWQRIVWLLRYICGFLFCERWTTVAAGPPTASERTPGACQPGRRRHSSSHLFLSFSLFLVSYYWTPTEFRVSFLGESFDCFLVFFY
jgi:hypothetical protein